MNEPPETNWEDRVRQAAGRLRYPPTPDIAGRTAARLRAGHAPTRRAWMPRAAWALAALALALAGLWSVPPVRAAVAEFLRVGVVTIFFGPPSATPAATARPFPSLAGETTLDEARAATSLPIRLPAYPADLGPPDRVFVQDQGGPVVVLVWTAPGEPGRVRLSLHVLAPNTWGIGKFQPAAVEETVVNGGRAIWTTGPYMLVAGNGNPQEVRLIEGHVLIWTEGGDTYRLETDLPLREAVQVAESLR